MLSAMRPTFCLAAADRRRRRPRGADDLGPRQNDGSGISIAGGTSAGKTAFHVRAPQGRLWPGQGRKPASGSKGQRMAKNTICVWYDKDAEAAARFYAETFPDSAVGAIHRAPGDYPSGKEGDVLIVEFKVAGVSCIGLNGGPMFKHNEAFSFQIATDDPAETDR